MEGGGERVVDWIWSLCNMSFESDVMLCLKTGDPL